MLVCIYVSRSQWQESAAPLLSCHSCLSYAHMHVFTYVCMYTCIHISMTRVNRATFVLLQLSLICTHACIYVCLDVSACMYIWRAAVTRQKWRGWLGTGQLHLLLCGYGDVGRYTQCLVWYRPPRVMSGVGPTPRMCSVYDVIGRESWDRVVSEVFVLCNSAPKGGVKSYSSVNQIS